MKRINTITNCKTAWLTRESGQRFDMNDVTILEVAPSRVMNF